MSVCPAQTAIARSYSSKVNAPQMLFHNFLNSCKEKRLNIPENLNNIPVVPSVINKTKYNQTKKIPTPNTYVNFKNPLIILF